MLTLRLAAVLVAVALPCGAWAQSQALVLKDLDPWGYTAIEDELAAAGIPFDVLGSGKIATIDPWAYTMIFVSSCQPDGLYQEWNASLQSIDAWVQDGGFLSIHGCNHACGASTGAVFPNPPGIKPTYIAEFPSNGVNLDQTHPLLDDRPLVMAGNSIAHTSFTNTGDPADRVLVTAGAVAGGNAILFERPWGKGTVIVGGLTYEWGWFNNQDAGAILRNAVAWGATFALCDEDLDADHDGVGDECDDCPGFDDAADLDLDGVADACDPCPLAAPDDADADGICDDIDDSDADGWADLDDLCPGSDDTVDEDADFVPDGCDNCPGLANATQIDADGDGHGDLCDLCPTGRNDLDADADGVANACDLCRGHDDHLDTDGDGVPDGCDSCPDAPNGDQADDDGDGEGDACDACPTGRNDKDRDADGIADACDRCDGFADADDLDADAVPDGCDLCVAVHDPDQRDDDGDGWGRACDCDDTDRFAKPHEPEICDGVDNDCDGTVDGPDPLDPETFYLDEDLDGHGVADVTLLACDPPTGWADNAADCDDANPHVRADAPEVCDGLDNDCDGIVDYEGCDPDAVIADEEPRPDVRVSGCATAPRTTGSLALLALFTLRWRRRGAGGR